VTGVERGINVQINDSETRDKLIQRLRRIEGQLRGVQSMLMEDRDCQEILQQMSAVRSAVQSAMLVTMQNYISQCLVEPAEALTDRSQREKLAADLLQVLGKMP
jgi:DNA-binding FrmR family transcriptional regulator